MKKTKNQSTSEVLKKNERIKPVFSKNAITVLNKRYFKKDDAGKIIEDGEGMFMRVAENVSIAEETYGGAEAKEKYKEVFYQMMANLDFLPNSPTLINAGKSLQQLSACFVLPIGDSMEEIFETVKQTALIHKTGGGTGFSFSRIRPAGSVVSTTKGIASGSISFMRVFDSATEVVKQGGCVEENTIISTEKGLLPIKEIGYALSGEYQDLYLNVYTDDGIKKAEQFYNNGIKPVKTIITKEGYKFTATLGHKIRIINKDGDYVWKKLKDINVDDWVVLQMNTYTGKRVKFKKFKRNFHFNTKLCTLPTEMSTELAEIIGYYMGNGCFYKGKLLLSIPHNNIDIKDYFDNNIKNIFNIDSRFEQKDNDKSINLIYHSQMLVEWFKSIKVNKKNSINAFIPEIILRGDRECALGFLRGLFEADGCVDKQRYCVSLSSTSRFLIHQTQVLLLSLGISSRISINTNREKSFGKNNIYVLSITTPKGLETYKNEIGFLSDRKQKRLNQIIERHISYNDIIPNQSKKFRKFYENFAMKYGTRSLFYKKVYHYMDGVKDSRRLTRLRANTLLKKYDFLKKSFLDDILNKNQYYAQVKKVYYSKKPTLDLVVSDNHTYIANGFVSHNTRRGANMAVLRVDHPDIVDFIDCKKDQKSLNNFNISVAITDEFMQALYDGGDYSLIDPRTQKAVNRVTATKIFNMIIDNAHRNGEPGIIFIDRINKYNATPEIGLIESTNPCGEMPLLPYESCNLGSINLSNFVTKKGKIDFKRLGDIVDSSVRFLDDVIDCNSYPLKRIEENTLGNRKIGLGVMGYADMLLKMNIPYDSEKGVETGGEVMKFINERAHRYSEILGEERGNFPNHSKSIYKNIPFKRNATVTTIAPTGTISLIAGVSSGIEPLFALIYYRNVLDGEKLPELHHLFKERMEQKGLLNDSVLQEVAKKGTLVDIKEIPEDIKRLFITSHDIKPDWHIKMQAEFQKYTDNAVSKTVNLQNSATKDDIRKVYLLAYRTGCKGVTVYRDRSREEQVLMKAKPDKAENVNSPRKRPYITQGKTVKMKTGCGKLYVTINEDEFGLCEVFGTMGKAGGCTASQCEAISRLISICLRSNIETSTIIRNLKGISCPNSTWDNGQQILSCSDAISKCIEIYLNKKVSNGVNEKKQQNLQDNSVIPGGCPSCGSVLIHAEGCAMCRVCGYSKCG